MLGPEEWPSRQQWRTKFGLQVRLLTTFHIEFIQNPLALGTLERVPTTEPLPPKPRYTTCESGAPMTTNFAFSTKMSSPASAFPEWPAIMAGAALPLDPALLSEILNQIANAVRLAPAFRETVFGFACRWPALRVCLLNHRENFSECLPPGMPR